MDKYLISQMIFLIIILMVNSYCTNKELSTTKTIDLKNEQLNLILNNDENKILKYTSGISSMLHDSNGNYWFGSQQEGVCLFDGKTFQYFTIKDGLSDNQIRSIQEDSKGNIWFGTAKGVSSYDGTKILNHTQKDFLTSKESSLNKWAKTEKDFWFNGGNSSGVYRYDGQNLIYLSFPKTKLINPNKVYHSTGFSKGKNNQIWIATYAGVFGYNGKLFSIINDESLGLNYETGYLHVRSILEDSKGNLWVGNNGIGVLLINGDSTINFSKENSLIHSQSSNGGASSPPGTLEHVFAIEEDEEGNIWFGDRDTGAWKYDGKTITNYTEKNGLMSKFVQSIYKDKKGGLWFGTGDGSVYKFNGKSFDRKYNK